MIRNLLYSFFLHFILIALIYFSGLVLLNKPGYLTLSPNVMNVNIVDVQEFEKMYKKKKPKEKKVKKPVPVVKKSEKKIEKKKPEVKAKSKKVILSQKTPLKKKLKKKVEIIEKDKFVETIFDDENDLVEMEEYKVDLLESQVKKENDLEYKSFIELSGKNIIELSLRERINLQRQIKSCYKRAMLKSGADSKSIVSVTIKVNRDGFIDMKKIKIEKHEDESLDTSDEDFKIAIDNAKTALIFCSPLRNLPLHKYRAWKRVTLLFNTNNLN